MLHKQYYVEKAKVDKLVARKNQKSDFYNGIYDRYQYPVLTREFAPLHWRYDLNEETNPYFEERLGINAVMNSGAIELNAVQSSRTSWATTTTLTGCGSWWRRTRTGGAWCYRRMTTPGLSEETSFAI